MLRRRRPAGLRPAAEPDPADRADRQRRRVSPGVGNVIILSGYVTSPQDADIDRPARQQRGRRQRRTTSSTPSRSAACSRSRSTWSSPGGPHRAPAAAASTSSSAARPSTFRSIVSGLLSGTQTGAAGLPARQPEPRTSQFGIVPAQFFGALQALRTEGLAKFLAEPRVVTQTGRPAFFRAGGQQAILSPTVRHHRPRRAAGAVRHRAGGPADRVRQRQDLAGSQPADPVGQPRPRASPSAFGVSPGFTEQQVRVVGDAGVGPDVRHRRADPEQRPGQRPRRCRSSATCRSSGPRSAASATRSGDASWSSWSPRAWSTRWTATRCRSGCRARRPAARTIMSYSWKASWRPRGASGRCGTGAATTPPTSATRRRPASRASATCATAPNGGGCGAGGRRAAPAVPRPAAAPRRCPPPPVPAIGAAVRGAAAGRRRPADRDVRAADRRRPAPASPPVVVIPTAPRN